MSNQPEHKILVVDDEASVRTTVSLLLKSQGYEVSTAKNGFDALLQLKRSGADLVISDLNMPQMSGFELLSVLRRRKTESNSNPDICGMLRSLMTRSAPLLLSCRSASNPFFAVLTSYPRAVRLLPTVLR